MPEFYEKYKEKIHYLNGEKYIHISVFKKILKKSFDNTEQLQQRVIDAENILMKISNNKIVSFLFGKLIYNHIKKYKNQRLKF